MINTVGTHIRRIREKNGISQEAMALELDITQSNYGRLEKNDNRLTIPKIKKIAQVLDTTVSYLLDEKSAKVINQENNKNPQAYNVDTIINSDKNHITSLKEEIDFLRKALMKQ